MLRANQSTAFHSRSLLLNSFRKKAMHVSGERPQWSKAYCHLKHTAAVLIMAIFAGFCSMNAAAQLCINEFSNGTNGAKEFYELAVTGTPGGFQDLRGWIVDDHSGYFGCASSNGIASGHLRFANIPNWACVKVGSIIVIYNPADPNTALTLSDDFTDANADYVYVLPISAAGMFDVSTSAPSSSNCNDFSGPTNTSGGGTSWSCIALGNGGDAVEVVDPANTSAPLHAISYGSVLSPATIHFAGSGSGQNYSFLNTTSNDYTLPTNWASGSASTQDSPGMANNANNLAWLLSLRASVAHNSLSGCEPFAATLKVNNVGPGLTANWNFGDGSTGTGDSLIHTYVSLGTYTAVVTISNGNGCSYSDTTIVDVSDFSLSFPTLPNVCVTSAVQVLSASPSGGNFSGPGISASNFDPQLAGAGIHVLQYALTQGSCTDTVTQSIEVLPLPVLSIDPLTQPLPCEGTPVELQATGDGVPSWSTGATATSISIAQSGWYFASLSNQCGTAMDSVSLSFKQPPTANLGFDGPSALCEGSTVVLKASGGDAYLWSTGASGEQLEVSAIGSYSVTVSNDCGSATAAIVVEAKSMAPYNLKAATHALCKGKSTSLTLEGGPFQIEWSTGTTSPTIQVSEPGIYTVTFSDACAERVDTVTIESLPAPSVRILQDGPLEICQGESVVLNASFSGAFSWENASTNPDRTVSRAGTFVAKSTTTCGVAIDSIRVLEKPLPDLEVQQRPLEAIAPEEVRFFVHTEEELKQLEWFLEGEAVALNSEEWSNYFEESGEYTLELTFSDEGGCIASLPYHFTIGSRQLLFFPTAFTPDGDRLNDVFQVKGSGIDGFELELFDRWGHPFYHWKGLEGSWDGTINGTPLPPGIYAYRYFYTSESGQYFQGQGSVTLIR